MSDDTADVTRIEFQRGVSALVTGDEVRMRQAGAGAVVSRGDLALTNGGGQLMFAGGNVTIREGGAQTIVARGDVSIEDGGAVVAIGSGVEVREATVAIALGRRVGLPAPVRYPGGAVVGSLGWCRARRPPLAGRPARLSNGGAAPGDRCLLCPTSALLGPSRPRRWPPPPRTG
jgi:hypothetical protein